MATVPRFNGAPHRERKLELVTIRQSYGDQAANLAQVLKKNVRGEVRFDPASRSLYAADLSIYRQVPVGVVIPRDADDVIATVAACRCDFLPRGGRSGCLHRWVDSKAGTSRYNVDRARHPRTLTVGRVAVGIVAGAPETQILRQRASPRPFGRGLALRSG